MNPAILATGLHRLFRHRTPPTVWTRRPTHLRLGSTGSYSEVTGHTGYDPYSCLWSTSERQKYTNTLYDRR